MKYEFRPLTTDDHEFIHQAHTTAYREVVERQFGRWDETLQNSFVEQKLNGPPLSIVMVDGVSCGFVGVDELADHFFLREIVLVPQWQGRGLGTAILQDICRKAATRGLPVRLRVLLENHRARALYERIGFAKTGASETHEQMEWQGCDL